VSNEGSNPVVARGDYGIISYSQEGEDVVLRRFVGESKGFYVDLGAHHPQRFSNTYYYYKLGWNGINVDADPDLIEEFNIERPNDINISTGIGEPSEDLTFYVFNERAVNTFDKKLATMREGIKGWKIVERRTVPVVSIVELLDKHLPRKKIIDFMTVDIEGKDLEALRTNDWEKYRPRFLLIECYDMDSITDERNKIIEYLAEQEYITVARTYLTNIFADTRTYGKK